MKFRNYCIVVMGKTDGCRLEISKISESQPNFLPAKGITIATFTSAFEPNELTDYFKSFNRNFLIFDLAEETSGYNFENKVISRDLFGFINSQGAYELEEMSNKLIDEIHLTSSHKPKSGNTKQATYESKDDDSFLEDIDKLTKKKKDKLMNDIIDKGIDNLTSKDKKILDYLSKK